MERKAQERKMAQRDEIGEEAWAAEMRRRTEHRNKKKINYQTTKKCKDALEWCQDAAKFPTTQTFNQHTVIERLGRCTQVIRELDLRKKQGAEGRPVIHYLRNGGVYTRFRTDADEVRVAATESRRNVRELAA